MIPELGRLVEVDLREAWPHEAHSLTPWLAANLDHLSQLLDLRLELEGTEVAVERFAADLLARNISDGTLVLIENQLEASDHWHLGQILTYLAGLDAKTVIWIAREFREPHLSALRWLNEHTDESCAFFAVRLRAVRIGDSLPAPQFEILCRPNGWERRLHTIAQTAQSEYGQLCSRFWSRLLLRHPSEAVYGPANGGNTRRRTLRDLGLYLGAYVGRQDCGVFVRGAFGAENETVFERLASQREVLEAGTGVALEPHAEGRYLIQRHPIDPDDDSSWDVACDWLHRTVNEYEAIVKRTFGARQGPTHED
ncbi:MAG: hypothetical protein KF774_13580 [Planctomyces sp.]|nr:hypothetical protein [Planctomyces sp.]